MYAISPDGQELAYTSNIDEVEATSTNDPAKKYPLKFLIHGGPQGAWGNLWTYRWNAELFAANGYVVVMINFHGSTGYGQKFTDSISGDWGGKPYIDLMKGLDYVEKTYPFIDKNREAALGASYGGYMANWLWATPIGSNVSCRTTGCSTANRLTARRRSFGSTNGNLAVPLGRTEKSIADTRRTCSRTNLKRRPW
jgi:dienelactone hydrolase